MPAMSHHAPHPLFSFLPNTGPAAPALHLTSLHLPTLALVEEIPHRRQTRPRPRRPAHAEDGMNTPTGTTGHAPRHPLEQALAPLSTR